MNLINNFHLKVIPNFSYKKERISLPLRNKDYYLFNLLHKKYKEKHECPKLSEGEFINNNKPLKKPKKLLKIKELNLDSIYVRKYIKNTKKEESAKNIDNNHNIFIIKSKKLLTKLCLSRFITKDKTKIDNLKLSNPNNALTITPLNNFNNNNFQVRKYNKKNRLLKKLKKSYTYKSYEEKEINKLNENYFLSNSLKNINSKQKKLYLNNNKISEGTQINSDTINLMNIKIITTIYRRKYCSPKSIIFHRELKKFQSTDNIRYI